MLSQIIKCARLYADSFMVFVQLSFGEFLTSELANHLTTGNVQFSTVIISGLIFSTSLPRELFGWEVYELCLIIRDEGSLFFCSDKIRTKKKIELLDDTLFSKMSHGIF